jgi:hypothetical protein
MFGLYDSDKHDARKLTNIARLFEG